MIRLCSKSTRRYFRTCIRRPISSSSSPPPPPHPHPPSDNLIQGLKGKRDLVPPPHLHQPLSFSTRFPPAPPRTLLFVVSAAAFMAVYAFHGKGELESSDFYDEIEQLVDKSKLRKIVNGMKQTAAAASVLWKSLYSVMSVRSAFDLRVAGLLADIAAANDTRRAAIVAAGGGAVVDWLLETASSSSRDAQAESARALAYLIADPTVCQSVLGRPHAVPHLLRFIFSAQPRRSKKVSYQIKYVYYS